MEYAILPLIAAAIPAVASVVSAFFQKQSNTSAHDYQTQMYAQQRKDSLADWNMQNEYNTPAEQMSRLKAAGLNPNLVYGNGADVTAGPVRTSSAGSYTPHAPQVEMGESISAFQQAQLQNQQINNLQAQNTLTKQQVFESIARTLNTGADTIAKLGLPDVQKADIALKNANTMKTATDQALGEQTIQQRASLFPGQMEFQKGQIYKQDVETNKIIKDNERAQVTNDMNAKQAVQAILESRARTAKTYDERKEIQARIRALQQDVKIRKLDEQLSEQGMYKHDNFFFRQLLPWLTPNAMDRGEARMSTSDDFGQNDDGTYYQK